MSRPREEMMNWALGEIGKAQGQGITIKDIFERAATTFPENEGAQNEVWQSLLHHTEVLVGDATTAPILSKLTLEDTFLLGLGDKILTLRNHQRLASIAGRIDQQDGGPLPTEATTLSNDTTVSHNATKQLEGNIAGLIMASQAEPPISTLPAGPPLSITPAKRRGRPPKQKLGAGKSPNVSDTTKTITAKRRGRPPKVVQNDTISTPTARRESYLVEANSDIKASEQSTSTTIPSLEAQVRSSQADENPNACSSDLLQTLARSDDEAVTRNAPASIDGLPGPSVHARSQSSQINLLAVPIPHTTGASLYTNLHGTIISNSPLSQESDIGSPSQQIMDEVIQSSAHKRAQMLPQGEGLEPEISHSTSVEACSFVVIQNENLHNPSGWVEPAPGKDEALTETTDIAINSVLPTNSLDAAAFTRIEAPEIAQPLRTTRTQNGEEEATAPRARRQKVAKFTTWDEMQREAGVSGVYFDEQASQARKIMLKHHKCKSFVLVFKSAALQNSQWLQNNKGTWQEPVFSRIGAAALQVVDAAEVAKPKQKRPYRKRTITEVGIDGFEQETPNAPHKKRRLLEPSRENPEAEALHSGDVHYSSNQETGVPQTGQWQTSQSENLYPAVNVEVIQSQVAEKRSVPDDDSEATSDESTIKRPSLEYTPQPSRVVASGKLTRGLNSGYCSDQSTPNSSSLPQELSNASPQKLHPAIRSNYAHASISIGTTQAVGSLQTKPMNPPPPIQLSAAHPISSTPAITQGLASSRYRSPYDVQHSNDGAASRTRFSNLYLQTGDLISQPDLVESERGMQHRAPTMNSLEPLPTPFTVASSRDEIIPDPSNFSQQQPIRHQITASSFPQSTSQGYESLVTATPTAGTQISQPGTTTQSQPVEKTPKKPQPKQRKRRVKPLAPHANDTVLPGTPGKQPALSRRQQIAAQKAEVEVELQRAASASVKNFKYRLPSIYNKFTGNLLLSEDSSILEFVAVRDDQQVEPPILIVPVSQLIDNPITSASGSFPMELRIVSQKDGQNTTHSFQFSTTPTGSTTASEMRAKIVTARIALHFNSGNAYSGISDAKETAIKPWKCESCGQRYKNQEGLKYHVNHSQTTCNPNFDPSQVKKRGGRRPKAKRASPDASKKSKYTQKSDESMEGSDDEVDQAESEPDLEEGESLASESDDSILEWAKRHATTGTKPGNRDSAASSNLRKNRTYRSMPGETSVLQKVVRETLATSGTDSPQTLSRSDDSFQAIIIDLVQNNGGLFPGDKSLWIAFVAAWLKGDDTTGSLPGWKVCQKALDELLDDHRLQTTSFTFRDNQSRDVVRSIITNPGLDSKATNITSLRKEIEGAHPQFYVPPRFAPIESVLIQLQRIVRPSSSRRGPSAGDSDNELRYSSFSDEEDPFLTETVDQSLDHEDGIYHFSRSTRKKRSTNKKPTNQSIAIRKWWAERKAAGLTSDRSTRREEGRKTEEALESQAWPQIATSITFLPNPNTGAWDQEHHNTINAPRTRKAYREGRLPEPVTYIQAPDGSWSGRAFGHGANPIFQRPSRQAFGSASWDSYKERIDHGFRPIIYPSSEKRLHLPAKPSKRIMARLSSESQSPQADLQESVDVGEDSDFSDWSQEEGKHLRHDGGPRSRGRISNATRKPARRYNLKYAESSREETSISDDEITAPWAKVSQVPIRRTPRNSSLPVVDLDFDESQIVNFFEPKKLEARLHTNPGLDTLPDYFRLPYLSPGPTNRLNNVLEPYENLRFVDPEFVTTDKEVWEGSWASTQKVNPSAIPAALNWNDDTAFTVDTLPYNDLPSENEEYQVEISRPRKRLSKGQNQVAQSVKSATGNRRTDRLRKVRRQTALPGDFQGVLEDPSLAESTFDVQVAHEPEGQPYKTQRQRTPRGRMTSKLERRFVVAVTAVQSLTGGVDGSVDFVLLDKLFPEFTINFMTKYWLILKKSMPKVLDEIGTEFREAFLPAYASREVPPINFDDLVGYNWNRLIDWALAVIQPTLVGKSVVLPATRNEINNDYRMTLQDDNPNDWRNSYFLPGVATYRQAAMFGARSNTVSAEKGKQRTKQAMGLDEFTVLKSIVRATAISPEKCWSRDKAAKKLSEFEDDEEKTEAIEVLKAAKIIVRRKVNHATPGRIYDMHDTFMAPLRRHIKDSHFFEARNFKRLLDEEFSQGKVVRLNYACDEGSVMCLTSLQAASRVTVTMHNIPMKKFGLTGGGYETKKIPKSAYEFPMDISPTSSYIYDNDNSALSDVEKITPPPVGKQGEHPAWIGINERLDEYLWMKVVVAFAQTIALREGVKSADLKELFHPSLEEWEMDRLIGWAIEVGLMDKIHPRIDGWMAREWWWLIVGQICHNAMTEE
ncbi:hypothetical protein BGZ60DRAFT_527127 [Tricladium varicosporioides]|nr:hypothetical protein BGZ60DRAFT_527127 [Hymenoscyphus varicosporioides]